MKNQFSYESRENYNLLNTDLFKIVLISFFGFLTPILFANFTFFPNQLLIGTIVNALLVYSAFRFSFVKSLPIILLPSIGTLLSGILFGAFSFYLLYLIPFIWLGNCAFVYLIRKYAVSNNRNYFITTTASAIAKTLIIFIPTLGFVLLGLIPSIFLIPMSLIQLVTAISGMLIAKVIV